MNIRTNLRRVLADPLHPVRIVLYIVFAILILSPVQERLLRLAGWGNKAAPVFQDLLPAYPAILAGEIERSEGILGKAGASTRGIWSGPVASALLTMLIQYVVGPAALVWGLRAWFRYRNRERVRGGATAIAFALAIGGFTLFSILPSPVYAIKGSRLQADMVRDWKIIEMQDDLYVELYLMARKAQMKYHRSGRGRGDRHSWLVRGHSGSPAIRIADLIERTGGAVFTDSMTVRVNGKTISLHVERSDSLTIRGEIPIKEGTLVFDPGAQPRYSMVLSVGVTPDKLNTVFED